MTENWTRKASCWLHLRGLEQNTPLLAFSLLCEKILRIQATERGGSVRIKWDSAHLTHSGRKSTRPFQLVLVQHQLRWLKWKDCESRSFPHWNGLPQCILKMYFPSEKGVTLIHRVPWFHPLYKRWRRKKKVKSRKNPIHCPLSPEYSINCTWALCQTLPCTLFLEFL